MPRQVGLGAIGNVLCSLTIIITVNLLAIIISVTAENWWALLPSLTLDQEPVAKATFFACTRIEIGDGNLCNLNSVPEPRSII